jgi:zinc D-Ala-D-Ala dipeptidase
VDDPGSSHYNKIVEATSGVAKDWSSWEDMRRSDDLYSLLALIDHNGLLEGETPVPGSGSCIFLHLWSGPGSPTIGCTALDGCELHELLLALVSFDKVVLIQLPRAEYDDAVKFWGMPPMPG